MGRALVSRIVALFAAAFVLAPAAVAAAGPPAFPHLPGGWSHAEINVRIARRPHTLILDHGRIIAVAPTQITIREPDTSVVTIPLSAVTRVVLDGVPATILDLRKRMTVETMEIDGGAAVRVRAQSPIR